MQQTKQALDKETHERKQEAPVLQKMLDSRMEVLSEAFRVSMDALRDEVMGIINPLQDKVE